MKNFIKVLKVLDSWESNRCKQLIIEELEKYNTEITPKLRRNGWYYNRLEDISWIEVDGRAWLEDNPSMFKYSLDLLNHEILSTKLKDALLTILRSSIKLKNKKELHKLLVMDANLRELREIRRGVKANYLNVIN